MTRKPGRLYRTLPVAPLFTVDAGKLGVHGDDTIESISIRRGDRSTITGLAPSTATVTITGDLPTSYDQAITIRMTSELTAWAASQTGRDPGDLWPRWVGRIGKQTVTDPGPAHRSTRLECADWAAQLKLTGLTAAVQSDDTTLTTLYRHAWNNSKLPGTWTNDGTTPKVATPNVNKQIKVADILGKYGADVGISFYTDKTGDWHAIGGSSMQGRALGFSLKWPRPILRSMALSPATWEQPAASPGQIVYKQRSHDNETSIETVTMSVWGGGPIERPIRAANMDTTDVWDPYADDNSDLTIGMLARANRAAGLWYNVGAVTVDILHLITSDNPDDRALAGQLLALEIFQPVALLHDWPDSVAGLTIATEITETITPDAWTLTLGLQRVEYVTGQHTSDIHVPGTTWDTAYLPFVHWDMAKSTWDGPPVYEL